MEYNQSSSPDLVGMPARLVLAPPFIKGYLCYKTITSQNVSSEAQVKNLVLKSYVMFSYIYRTFCVFDHPMIYQICDIMISISS